MGLSVELRENQALIGAVGGIYFFDFVDGNYVSGQRINGLGNNFGVAFDLHENILVVGAPSDDHAGFEEAGSFYVLHYNEVDNQWKIVQKVLCPDPQNQRHFGYSVAFDGQSIIVGAPGFVSLDPELRGLIYHYTFDHNENEWTHAQTLQGSIGHERDYFGMDVAMDQDLLVVGSPLLIRSNGQNDGGFFLFQRDSATGLWAEINHLAIAGSNAPWFGFSVDIMDNIIAIGGPNYGVMPDHYGLVHVYEVLDDELERIGSFSPTPDYFRANAGYEVFIVSPTKILFAHRPNDIYGPGRVHVAERVTQFNTFTITGFIDPPDADQDFGGDFGSAFAMYDDLLLIGSQRDDQSGFNTGAAYLYDLAGGCPATLESVDITFGTLLSGGLDDLYLSDDGVIRARSAFGFLSSEPNLLRTRVVARGDKSPPPNEVLHIRVVGRVNNPNSTWTWSLRDQSSGGGGSFITVHSYMNSSVSETTENFTIENADSFIDDTTGNIELEIKQSVIATFSLSGFTTELDRVRIGISEVE